MILKDYRERHTVDREFYRKMVSLTMPIAFQQFMLAAVAAADSIMLGRLEQNSMAAVSLATQIQFVLSLFIFAFAVVLALPNAKYFAEKYAKKTWSSFLIAGLLVWCIFSFTGVSTFLYFNF